LTWALLKIFGNTKNGKSKEINKFNKIIFSPSWSKMAVKKQMQIYNLTKRHCKGCLIRKTSSS